MEFLYCWRTLTKMKLVRNARVWWQAIVMFEYDSNGAGPNIFRHSRHMSDSQIEGRCFGLLTVVNYEASDQILY